MYNSIPLIKLPTRQRFDAFQGLVDTAFCPMEIEATLQARQTFAARADSLTLGDVQLVRVATTPIRVRRQQKHIARIDAPPYLVKFQLYGQCLGSQRGREAHLRSGDFLICSTAEPYSLTFPAQFDMPVLVIPQSTMRRLTPDPDRFLGFRMSGEDADCGLLSSFVAQIAVRMSKLPPSMLHRIRANVLDLLGAVLSSRTPRVQMSRDQLLAQVKVYIQNHLHDRQLGPTTLSQAFSVSTRLIHTLFEHESETVGAYIRRLRVDGCKRALEASSSTDLSLTDLALRWGFYDLSHLIRSFRKEYGIPPRRFLLATREAASGPLREPSPEGKTESALSQ